MLKTGGLKPMLTITRSQDAVGSNLDPGYTDYPRNFQHGAFVPNAGAYGAGVNLPTQSSPPDPSPTPIPIEPTHLITNNGGGGDHGIAGFDPLSVGWFPSINPAGVTGYGTTAPSGVYGAGGGPTAVPTFWGNSGGGLAAGAAGGSDMAAFLRSVMERRA